MLFFLITVSSVKLRVMIHLPIHTELCIKFSGLSKLLNLDNDLKVQMGHLPANLRPYVGQNREICLTGILNVSRDSLDSDCYTGQFLNRTGGGCYR